MVVLPERVNDNLLFSTYLGIAVGATVVSFISFMYLCAIKFSEMEAIIEKTSRNEQRIAKSSLPLFKKVSNSLGTGKKVVEISFSYSDETFQLPAKVVTMMVEILTGMSTGRSVAVIQTDVELTTQDVADFLEVSRPHVVRLLENGVIPFRKVGAHRRVKMSDLIVYQKSLQTARKKQMKFLAKQAQDLNLEY